MLGTDELDMTILKNSFVIYIGHHGDKGANIADIILPSPAYTEKNSLYVNLEGRVIKSQLCHPPLGDAKNEWKIFRKLAEKLSIDLNFNNLSELRKIIYEFNPIFSELNVLHNNNFLSFGIEGKISDDKLEDLIKNFYMTDPISRSSKTMAQCTQTILNLNKDEINNV